VQRQDKQGNQRSYEKSEKLKSSGIVSH